MRKLTDADFDRLALDYAEIIGFVSGATVDYDVAGYDRCQRVEVDPDSLAVRNHDLGETPSLPQQAEFIDESYLVRLAGFRRRNIFGPDEIGETLQRSGIAWSDGLGNGLYESLSICRKYGLGHVLEAPILGIETPFLDPELEVYKAEYPRYVRRLIEDLKRMEPIYGGKLTGEAPKYVVLWELDYPLAHFMRAYRRSPDAVGVELANAIGTNELPIVPETPAERFALVKFWNWVRHKQSQVAEIQADILREMLGPNTVVIANPHELPVLDFDGQRRAYDIPAVAVRPLLLYDDLMLRHYVAYYSQLYHDLTESEPMLSVRMNLSAATPTFVPTGNLMRAWYDQSVRHGAGSFYFWTRDYPPNNDPQTYDGPIPGNPIKSTLPQERWEASLNILGQLSTHQRFLQPKAEVGILVPIDAALLDRVAWRRIYSAFSALTEQKVFSNFISDRQLVQNGAPARLRLLIAPELEFVSSGLRKVLEGYVEQGGTLLVTATQLSDSQSQPITPLDDAKHVEPAIFNVFPLGSSGDEHVHRKLEDTLLDYVLKSEANARRWVFEVCCDNLPPTKHRWLRSADPEVYFAPWLYEHGSEWIMPHLKDLQPGK